jgi:hypothetical protein
MGRKWIEDCLMHDFSLKEEKFLFDAVAKRLFMECKPILKSNGRYITTAFSPVLIIKDNYEEFLLVKFLIYNLNLIPIRSILLDKITSNEDLTVGEIYPYIFAYEYPLDTTRSDAGKMDLILTNGEDPLNFLLIEVKFMGSKSGPTARKRRNMKRSEIYQQARSYAFSLQTDYQEATVLPATFTDEHIQRHRYWKLREKDITRDLRQKYQEFRKKEWKKVNEIFNIELPNEYVEEEEEL